MAWLFNGVFQRLTGPFALTDAIAGKSAISIACWFRGGAAQSCIRLETQTTPDNYVILSWTGGNPGAGQFVMDNDGPEGSGLAWPSALVDQNWHHMAASWGQNATKAIYLDGVLAASVGAANTPTGAFTARNFGPSCGDNTNGFGEATFGTIAIPAIWLTALSGSDIASLAAGTLPTSVQSGSLLSYWPLAASASILPDIIGGFNFSNSGGSFAADPPILTPAFQPFSAGNTLYRLQDPPWY